MQVTLDDKKKTLTITLPLEAPGTKSASGKTEIVATTRGNKATEIMFDGKPITVGLTAYVKPTA